MKMLTGEEEDKLKNFLVAAKAPKKIVTILRRLVAERDRLGGILLARKLKS